MDTDIRFVYFDLGNVIVNFDHNLACKNIGKVVGLPADAVRSIVFDSGLELDYERGELSDDEVCEKFCDAAGVRVATDDLLFALSDIFQLNSGVLSIITQLRVSNVQLGVLSNTCSAHWNHCWDRYTILRNAFSKYALSFELGCLKPDAEIYEKSLQLAGVPAEQIVFIDDRLENVAGAEAAGWTAIQFHDAHQLHAELRSQKLLPCL